jgi:hypothetical protein
VRSSFRHLARASGRRTAVPAVVGAVIAAGLAGLAPGNAAAATSARACRTVAGIRICGSAAIGLSRSRLTAVGGLVTIHYSAAGATACWLRARPVFWRGHNPARVACHGTYRIRITPAQNRRAWTFTFTARTRAGTAIRVARSLVAVAAPRQPLVTAYQSSNWSGYAVEGGGFSGAQGSFTVPTLTGTPAQADTSEWVGVDGVSNASLIQAGVHEVNQAGTVSTYAWWEILPAAETAIDPAAFPVAAGDTVTVQLRRVATHWWKITLVDGTHTFSITRPYSGPLTSAEWIVEAPSYGSTIQQLGNFSTTPVAFSNMAVNGVQMAFDQIVLLQNGFASTPTTLLPTGFTVNYAPVGP